MKTNPGGSAFRGLFYAILFDVVIAGIVLFFIFGFK